MQLLSPDEIKKDRSESAEESLHRSRALATEESRLARAINQARQNAAQEMEIIDNDYKEFKAEKEAERQTLIREVNGLQVTRAELLKPIDEIKAAAQKTLSDAESKAADIERQAQSVAQGAERNQELAEALADRQDEQDARDRRSDQKEKANSDEAARLKLSAETLAGKWAEFHETVHKFNQRVKAFEHDQEVLRTSTQANEIKQKELDNDRKEIERDRITIKSQYEALGRARIQILGH